MENAYVLELTNPLFKDFYLCFCGYSACKPLHSYGPAARPNYIIHYILEGKGVYRIGERKYHLSRGQGFLIEPEDMTYYQADQREPWTYVWIGFNGAGAARRLKDVGLSNDQPIFQCRDGEALKGIVLDMLRHLQATVSNLYYLQGMLYQFFSVLIRDAVLDPLEEQSEENVHLSAAIQYIKNHCFEGIDVEDIANAVNVNRSYLYAVFKSRLGITPKEYLTKARISRARDQLALTDDSIERIAEACGYQSALAFSRAFKAELEVTPSQYRRESRRTVLDSLAAGQEELKQMKRKAEIG